MRLFPCAGRRFIAPTYVFYAILSGATLISHTSHVHAMISPILSSLSSNPLLRRYPLAHISCFSSRTLYALLMSCCISVLAKFVSCLPYNRRAIVHSSLFFPFTYSSSTQRLLEAPQNGPRSNSTCSGVSCSIPRSSASCLVECGESESATSARS